MDCNPSVNIIGTDGQKSELEGILLKTKVFKILSENKPKSLEIFGTVLVGKKSIVRQSIKGQYTYSSS